ncbi:claudin-8-like [Ascaphus truei]|uniref:claudin-8-like n=1 Tax=Ascaphus truei TaxID=8439 RepID=UPI003F5A4DD6
MACFMAQVVGIICGLIGMILTCVITSMPQWRVSILAENNGVNNRIDGQWMSRWDGLWSTCINQARLELQCTSYDSLGSIKSDLKAGRVLMSFAVVLSIIAFISSFVGMLFTRCHGANGQGKHCLLLTSGILFNLCAVLVLIPVSWITSNIVKEVYGSTSGGALRIEAGEALFLAWPTIVFLLVGGIIFCWHCPCNERKENCDYVPPQDQEMMYRVRQKEETPSSYHKVQYI